MTLEEARRPGIAEERLFGGNPAALALREALDRIWQAVVMVSQTGHLVYANSAALRILQRGSGVTRSIDLQLIPRCGFGRMRMLLAVQGGLETSISIPRPGQPPLILRVRPLPVELRSALGAEAYLFLTDPAAELEDCTDALMSAYGLTRSEARVVQSLTEGASLKVIAARQRVTYETVRTYVRRILSKTGVRRQAELVRLMLALR
jgi:DNA-binding CsgD family transcriptional regulator